MIDFRINYIKVWSNDMFAHIKANTKYVYIKTNFALLKNCSRTEVFFVFPILVLMLNLMNKFEI